MIASGGTLTALVGLLTMRLTLDGSFQRYVRSGMRPWLTMAAIALLVLGLVTIVRALRTSAPDDTSDGHVHTVGVGWLLLAPMAALLLVAPPSLGSYGVDRSTHVRVHRGTSTFQPLAAASGPVAMTLQEYTERSFDHDGASMHGATISLTGFVASGTTARSFRLARYQIACCAADAAASVVTVVGYSGSAPARDEWVRVTGTPVPPSGDDVSISVTGLQEIAAPLDPYE